MPITFNSALSRYEQDVDGHIIFARVRREGDEVSILHVEAPEGLRGTGAAGVFMQELMQALRAENIKKVVPVCGYAAMWLKRNKAYSDLL